MMPMYVAVAFYKHVVHCRLELILMSLIIIFIIVLRSIFGVVCMYRIHVKDYNCYIRKTWPHTDFGRCGFTSEEIWLSVIRGNSQS